MSEIATFEDLKSKILLIDEKGNQFKNISPTNAFEKAKENGLDLVKVGENQDYSVCKIMDFKKASYKKKDAIKHKRIKQKEIRFGPDIAQHDIDIKLKRINKFLKLGHNVKIMITSHRRKNSINSSYDKIKSILNLIDIPFVRAKITEKGIHCSTNISPSFNSMGD